MWLSVLILTSYNDKRWQETSVSSVVIVLKSFKATPVNRIASTYFRVAILLMWAACPLRLRFAKATASTASSRLDPCSHALYKAGTNSRCPVEPKQPFGSMTKSKLNRCMATCSRDGDNDRGESSVSSKTLEGEADELCENRPELGDETDWTGDARACHSRFALAAAFEVSSWNRRSTESR